MSTALASVRGEAGDTGTKASPPRDRILAVAQDLFYRHGIRAVGVEAIADAAGTNKMTLYRHFASKDILIAECLRLVAEDFHRDWQKVASIHHGDPRKQLLAWVRYVADFLISEADRGCALANAAVELADKDHPARHLVEAVKTEQHALLMSLCREGRYADPERLADELSLLFEGARVSIQSVGVNGPASRLQGLVEAIIESHTRE